MDRRRTMATGIVLALALGGVSFADGLSNGGTKAGGLDVRAVRGGA